MNKDHKIDYKRAYAAEYEKARTDSRFWSSLKDKTQQSIVMFFSDHSLPAQVIEEACGASAGSLRRALRTRGLYDESSLSGRRQLPVVHAPNAYTGPKGPTASPMKRSEALEGAIQALEVQMTDISAQMRKLSTEWDKLNAALTTLKGL